MRFGEKFEMTIKTVIDLESWLPVEIFNIITWNEHQAKADYRKWMKSKKAQASSPNPLSIAEEEKQLLIAFAHENGVTEFLDI